jgi:hypothetical protein
MKNPIFILAALAALYYPKQIQYDEDDGDDDQCMNGVAESRESGRYSWSEKAKQPQYN